MSMDKVQAGDSAGLRGLGTGIYTEGTLGVREPWTQVAPAPKQIERFPGFGLGTGELRGNQQIWGARVLGIARGGEENGRLGTGGGRARVANVGGEQFGIDTCGLGRGVVVNLS